MYSLTEDYLKFRYYNNNEFNYPEINCNYEINDEEDENEWRNVPVSFGYFKCATLRSANCKNYVVIWNIHCNHSKHKLNAFFNLQIRTVNTPYNIKLKADVFCKDVFGVVDPVSDLVIYPALKSENKTKGVCGAWSYQDDNEISNRNFEDEILNIDLSKLRYFNWFNYSEWI